MNTFLNTIEYDLNEDRMLFDEYLVETSSSSMNFLSIPKFIADHRWIEQFRQRIKKQIEPLKILPIE